MRKPQINRGVIFNHFPEIMIFASKTFSSESDCIIKTSRIIKGDPNIGADEQIFRKIREDRFSAKDWIDYLYGENTEIPKSLKMQLNSINSNSLGSWYILDSVFNSFKLSCDDSVLLHYVDYLLRLCEVDKKYIAATSKNATTNFSYLDKFVEQWLVLPGINFDGDNKKQHARYIIALVLHWAALFEHFLYLQWPELNEDNVIGSPSSILTRYIPRINSKRKLLSSVEVFLIELKSKWAKSKYSRTTIHWSTLYRDITRAKKPQTLQNQVDPDIRPIKKMFSRWRSGKTKLTIDSFKKNIAVLNTPYDPNYFDSTLLVILFVNTFDTIQKELISTGISPEYIVEQFERYQVYRNIVDSRYKTYCRTGAIEPDLI